MNRTKAVFMVHYWDNRKALTIFWSILFAVIALQYTLNRFILDSWVEGDSNNGTFVAVLIYFLVTGLLSVRGSLYLTLSLGGTRREYMLATVWFLLLLSAVNSLIMVILGYVEIELLNTEHFRMWFNMMDLKTARPDVLWLVQTLVLYAVVMFFFMLSSLKLRFGIPAYIPALLVLAANLSIPAARELWTDIFYSFYKYENVWSLFIGFLIAGIIFSLVSWVLLSRLSIKTSKA